MQQERDTTFRSLTVEKREKGKERVCAVCLEPLDDHSLSLEEIVAMMLKREQKCGEEEARRLLCCDEEETRQAEEEKNTVSRGYSFVGSELACREKHLLCGECVIEFAADPTNLSCPCCRSPLAPLFTLLHLLQVEKARANFMCSQQQAIRNLVDEFVEQKLTQLQERREGEEEEEAQGEVREGRGGGGKRKRPRLQAEEDRNCCGGRVIAINAACSWGNEFTEEIRYRTRAPDAREMLCMLRLKH